MCERIGANEIGDFRASSLSTLTQMVANGIGVTLLPELAVAEAGGRQRVTILPFAKKSPYRTIGLAWRRTSSRTSEFLMLAEQLRPGAR